MCIYVIICMTEIGREMIKDNIWVPNKFDHYIDVDNFLKDYVNKMFQSFKNELIVVYPIVKFVVSRNFTYTYNENILMINASSFNNNELLNTYISEFDKNFEIIRNIKSQKIDIKNKVWIIKDAEIYIQNTKEIVNNLKLQTNFDYELIQNLFSNMSSLSFIELIEMRENYKSLNYSLTEIDLQLLKLISFPFYFILMFIFAAIIMMNTKAFKSKSLKVIIGLFLSVIIYYINNFFYILGTSEKINVISSIFVPLIILTIINFLFMRNINAK